MKRLTIVLHNETIKLSFWKPNVNWQTHNVNILKLTNTQIFDAKMYDGQEHQMLTDRHTTDIFHFDPSCVWSDTVTPILLETTWNVFLCRILVWGTERRKKNFIYGNNLTSKVHYVCTFDGPPLAKKLGAFWAIWWPRSRRLGYYLVASYHPQRPSGSPQTKRFQSDRKTCFHMMMLPLFDQNISFGFNLLSPELEQSCKEERWESGFWPNRFLETTLVRSGACSVLSSEERILSVHLRHVFERCSGVDGILMRRCFFGVWKHGRSMGGGCRDNQSDIGSSRERQAATSGLRNQNPILALVGKKHSLRPALGCF